MANDRELVTAAENQLAQEVGLAPGELLLDYPEKTQMLDLDMPVVRRNGEVSRLTGVGLDGAMHLPRLADELYRSARWLRVFVAKHVSLDRTVVKRIASLSGHEILLRVSNSSPLFE